MNKFFYIHRTFLINTLSNHRKNTLVINGICLNSNCCVQSFETKVLTTQTHGKTKRLQYHENQPHLKTDPKHVPIKTYVGNQSLRQGLTNSLATKKLCLEPNLTNLKYVPNKIHVRNLSLSEVRTNCLTTTKKVAPPAQSDDKAIACWPKSDYGPMKVFRSEFRDGMRVAAAKPEGGLIAACTIMFRAGSRLEVDNEIGVSHFLRAASTLSGCCYSGFIKSRYLQHKGGYISVASDRQNISYTLRCAMPDFCELKHYLIDTAVRCQYFQHELDQIVKPMLHADLKRRPLQEHCMDLIQQACWAGPLANSNYCVKNRIDDMTDDTLGCFAVRLFKPSRCSIGSCGVPFEETLKVAEFIEVSQKRQPRPPELREKASYPRAGYEAYHYGRGGETYIALAVPTDGCTLDLCKVYAYAILAEAIGTGPIEQGSHVWDRVTTPPIGNLAGCDVHSDYRAFHIAYADRGMFGLIIKSNSHQARGAALRAADFFHRIKNITPEQINVGKQRLKVALCIHDDDCTKVSEGLALQVANCHEFNNAAAAMQDIDAVLVPHVQCAAQCVQAQTFNMAMAVVGDLDACPDDKELIR